MGDTEWTALENLIRWIKENTIEELKRLSEDILYLVTNEIYARHGYIFRNEESKLFYTRTGMVYSFGGGRKFQ